MRGGLMLKLPSGIGNDRSRKVVPPKIGSTVQFCPAAQRAAQRMKSSASGCLKEPMGQNHNP